MFSFQLDEEQKAFNIKLAIYFDIGIGNDSFPHHGCGGDFVVSEGFEQELEMSHEIDQSAGYAAAAYARVPAWHGLGKVLPNPMDPEEAIAAAGIGWGVSCQPVYRAYDGGSFEVITDRRIVVRDDTNAILGHVGTQFVPLQQQGQVDFLRGVVGEGCKIDACGSLRDGKRVWFLCDLKASYDVVKHDTVKPYLLTLNGHDGNLAWISLLTADRVVCANVLALAMSRVGLDRDGNPTKTGDGTGYVKLRHNGKLSENIEQAKLALAITRSASEKQAIQAKALAAKKMLTADLTAFFVEQVESLKFSKERSELVLQELAMGLDAETNSLPGMRGTAWQAFNVWGEWLDHAPRRVSPGVRMESLWVGDGARTKAKAWDKLLATV